jgi:hypothetical protein
MWKAAIVLDFKLGRKMEEEEDGQIRELRKLQINMVDARYRATQTTELGVSSLSRALSWAKACGNIA